MPLRTSEQGLKPLDPEHASGALGPSAERHYTVAEVAAMWNLSKGAVRRLFCNEPGVLTAGQPRSWQQTPVHHTANPSICPRKGTSQIHGWLIYVPYSIVRGLMLYTYRRHATGCAHRAKGRKHLRCQCPIWVDGRLNGKRFHGALGTTDWQRAQQIVRDLELDGELSTDGGAKEPITVEQAVSRFIADLEARKLRASTLRKYRLLGKQIRQFAADKEVRFLRQVGLELMDEFRTRWKDGLIVLKKVRAPTSFLSVRTKTQVGCRKSSR